MKIIALHGDDTIKSYERLQKFVKVARSRDWDIIKVEESNQTLPELLTSRGLFQNNRLIIAEGVNSLSKKEFKWLNKKNNDLEGTLVIYNQGVIPKKTINNLPKIDKNEEYKLPKVIWKFLDSFWPGNAKTAHKLLHETIENEPIEFVFALLTKHLRDVYWANVDPDSIPYPGWRVGKLKSQARKFEGKEQIKELINNLAEIDIKVKTSKADLVESLDFLIATKLE